MQRGEKWIAVCAPDEPVSGVARRAIDDRLHAVDGWLRTAAQATENVGEAIHQLRVASRRAAAALDVFAELCPRRERAAWKHRLRRIRRKAGKFRDLDVLVTRYHDDPGIVLGRLIEERQAARPVVGKLRDRWRKRRQKRRIRRLVRRVRWRDDGPEPTVEHIARDRLRAACDRVLAAAAAQPDDVEALHRLRIRGKQLRYAMEIFAAALPESVREELYPVVETLQEHLGRINDHATARARFERRCQKAAGRKDLESQREHQAAAEREKNQIDKSIAAFRSWWTPERAEHFRRGFAKALEPTAA
jgi:CHAD domain-containing protein